MELLTQECWLPLDGDQYHNGEHWPDRAEVYPYGVTYTGKVVCLTRCGQVLVLNPSDIDHPMGDRPNGHNLKADWLNRHALAAAYSTLTPDEVLRSLGSAKPLSNTESLMMHLDARYNARVGYIVFSQIEPRQ